MTVQHRRLGQHGVLVSNICLGTMNFGWHTSEEDSFRIMDRALELGINFFDTADVYGWSVEHGLTEEIIGRWLAQGGGRRDAIVLATKVYNPVDRKANLPEVNSDGTSLSAYKIRKHCEGSLRRLQTDWIDLYQMHHIDHDCPWDETWQSFDTLVKQGKVVYVGSSNFAGWDIATACQAPQGRRIQQAGRGKARSARTVRVAVPRPRASARGGGARMAAAQSDRDRADHRSADRGTTRGCRAGSLDRARRGDPRQAR